MQKYQLLRERLEHDGVATTANLHIPPAAQDHELCQVHDAGYVQRVSNGSLDPAAMRRIGFPWSAAMVERSRRSVGATIVAARAALRDGFAASLAGGTHHAFADRGEGFCVFNDVAVAIRTLQAEQSIENAVVIDLDVHQGNGTAALFDGDQRVFTLSVHGANNFPFHKETSDLDLALPDGASDDQFLDAVQRGIQQALQARPPATSNTTAQETRPLAFYLAGADPYEGDRLGRLSVTKNGLAERDCLVYDACRRAGLAVVIVMSGGYAHDVQDTVEIHAQTVSQAARYCAGISSSSR